MSASEFFSYIITYIRQQSRGISYQELLITWLIGIIIVHLIFMISSRITGKAYSWKKEVWYFLVVGYVCFGAQITLLRRAAGSRTIMYTSLDFGFSSSGIYSRQQFFYSLLNVLLFVPWGLLWGLYRWKDGVLQRMVMVTCYCFLTSFVIEITQLLTGRGYFEVADFVTNVIGGVIGAILACVLIFWKKVRVNERG